MGKYRILVDSSTKSKEGKYMVGPSTAAWLTYLNKRILCYGLIYFDYNGPNKAFYEGIIAALV